MRQIAQDGQKLLNRATAAYHALRHTAPAQAAQISHLQNNLAAAILAQDKGRIARATLAMADALSRVILPQPEASIKDRRARYRNARR